MKIKVILILIAITNFAIAQNENSINSILEKYITKSPNENAGIIVGLIDKNTDSIYVFSKGAIKRENDLRLVCPASKPVISYLLLRNSININSTINTWFPLKQGYTKSNEITIKMLLSNTSGIKDYVGFIDKDKICNAEFTVDEFYKNKELAFHPGESILYSNTGLNAAGVILEKETNKTIDSLIFYNFNKIAPSIRMDDNNGNYPKGYINPWPYHYSQSSFSGGVIGSIDDFLKLMNYLTKQPEFNIMTNWVKEKDGVKYGLGIFGQNNVVFYQGNSGANFSLLIMINSKIMYFHTTNELDYNNLQNYINKLIPLVMTI